MILDEIRAMMIDFYNVHNELPTTLNLSHDDRLELKCVSQLLPIEDVDFKFKLYGMDVLPSNSTQSTVE